MKSVPIFPLFLLVMWTGVIGAADFAAVDGTVRQLISRGFPAIQGKIVQSEMGHSAIGRRGIEIRYTYVINGKTYEGERYRYDDKTLALRLDSAVKNYPLWSEHAVYYNPKDPADALLAPGVDGSDFLLFLFALPINIVTFILWHGAIVRMREQWRMPLAGGVRILQQEGGIRVRLVEMSALAAGFYGMGAAAFFITFPVVFASGLEPDFRLTEIYWSIIFITGLMAFCWKAMGNNSGKYDLHINERAQTITLPQTFGRPAPVSFPKGEVTAISMLRRVTINTSGSHYSYLPALDRAAGGAAPQPASLVAWGWSEQKARAFSQWLSEKLGVQFKGIADEIPAAAKT